MKFLSYFSIFSYFFFARLSQKGYSNWEPKNHNSLFFCNFIHITSFDERKVRIIIIKENDFYFIAQSMLTVKLFNSVRSCMSIPLMYETKKKWTKTERIHLIQYSMSSLKIAQKISFSLLTNRFQCLKQKRWNVKKSRFNNNIVHTHKLGTSKANEIH